MSDFLHTTLLGKRIHRLAVSSEYGIRADGLRADRRALANHHGGDLQPPGPHKAHG